jgi:transcriptional regulator with XRE-family HTH domain
MLTELGHRVRALRLVKAMTQEELGDKAGLKSAAVSHVETGRRIPSVGTLMKLCRALDCSADELLGIARKP